jgi:glycosyltransferase involved in cell wall biosynthesis
MLKDQRNTSPRHLCVFTTAHPTDDVRVSSKIVASFLEAGYMVSWVGPDRAYFARSAEVDPRVNYHLVGAAGNRLSRLGRTWKITREARRLGPVDWWYCPDPDAAWAANVIARRQGGRVIFDIHEVYHGPLLERWLGGRRCRALRALVRRAIVRVATHSDLVIAVSASVLRSYAAADQVQSRVVRNCAPTWFSIEKSSFDRAAESPMLVIHGKVIASNGTSVVLDALEALKQSESIKVLMFDVTHAGDVFAAEVHKRIASPGFQQAVEIVDGVTHEEMPGLLANADVGMIAYGRGLGEESLPNRLFEYMASGLAVLAPSYSVEIVRIIEDEKIGVTADFDDPEDVRRALVWLYDHPVERREMGRRAQRAFLTRHSWPQEFDKLLAAMQSLGA